MGDAVLAEEDALCVDVLNALPGIRLRVDDRRVVGRHDPGVVVEDVDAAVALGRRAVHVLNALRVGNVDLLEERVLAL